MGAKARKQRRGGAGPVRDAGLVGDVGLGEAHAELGAEEQRVVAEAAGAARRVEDDALARARADEQRVAVGEGEDGAEARRAPLGRDAGERGEELLVVGGVDDLARGARVTSSAA